MVIKELTNDIFEEFYSCFTELMLEGYGQFPETLRTYFLQHDYTKENFRFWHEKGLRKIITAIEDNRIIGFLSGDHTYGGVAFVSWLGILEPYRKQGTGKQLLATYEKYVKEEKQAHLIELFTIEETVPFYEKHGFIVIGVREQGYFGQRNVIMDKQIGKWDESKIIR